MDRRAFLHYFVLTVCFTWYAFLTIQSVPMDINGLSDDCISDAVGSQDVCDITVDAGHSMLLRNNSVSMESFQAKCSTFFSQKYFLRYLNEQVQFLHVFDEAFLAKRFVICASFVVMSMAVIELLVVRRMGNLVKSHRSLQKLEANTSISFRKCLRDFALEKFIIVALCIIRSFPPPNNKHYIDFGEYVRDTLSLRSRSTDVTLFACWYCLLTLCHVSTHSIFNRYIRTIPLLERTLKTRLRTQSVFIVLFLTLNSFVALSGILVGAAGISAAFIHPDYTMILLFESFRVFIRSLYVVDRLSMSVSSNRMNAIEAQTELTDNEISEIIVNGFQINSNRRTFRSIYMKLSMFATITLYALYTKTGLLFNRKIAALGFVYKLDGVIHDVTNTDKFNSIDLI